MPQQPPPEGTFFLRLLAPGLCLLTALFMVVGWFGRVPQAHDLGFHMSALDQVREEMAHGDFFPRWLGDWNQGCGDPTLVFYPPLFYLVGGSLAQIPGVSTLDALVAALFVFSLVGSVGIYRLASDIGGRRAGILALLWLAVMPFRFFELYAAGLFPAYAAGCVMPWALCALWRLCGRPAQNRPDRWLRILSWSAGLALLVLCNLPYAVLAVYLAGAGVAVAVVGRRDRGIVLPYVAGSVGGLVLAAFYLLPAVAEWSDVTVPVSARLEHGANFVFSGAASWMPPYVQGVFDCMLLLPLLVALVAGSSLFASPAAPGSAVTVETRLWAKMLTIVALMAAFLTLPWSDIAWRTLPFLLHVNLPWRFLDPLSIAAAALAAVAAAAVSAGESAPYRRLTGGALAVLALLHLVASVSVLQMNGFHDRGTILAAVPAARQMDGDYLPRGARRLPAGESPALAETVSGGATGQVLLWRGSARELAIEAPAPSRLRLRTFYFAGWDAEWRTDAARQPLRPFAGRDGFIEVDVPAGSGRLYLHFGSTPLRRIAAGVSLLAWLAWAIAVARLLSARRAGGE